MTIQELVNNYTANHSQYVQDDYNEASVRLNFIDPFFTLLGWDVNNSKGQKSYQQEVIVEQPLTNATLKNKRPDYTFRAFTQNKFFVEAKKPSVNILSLPDPAQQIRRYGYSAGLKISVLTNFEDLVIYDTTQIVDTNDPQSKAVIRTYHYTDYVTHFQEIADYIGRECVYSGAFDQTWQCIQSHVVSKPVDESFLDLINGWRLLLGKDILAADPSMSLDQLNDKTQNYINKILFLRICEDRNIEQYQQLLSICQSNKWKKLIDLFHKADIRYNSGLFKDELAKAIIQNVSSAFWVIIRDLYYPDCPYSFNVFSSDILGKIYDIFLSKQLSVDNGQLSLIDKPENKDRSVVPTPAFIIREILLETIAEKCGSLSPDEIMQMKFADIACGSGAFLIEMFQLLSDTLVDFYKEHDLSKLIPTGPHSYRLNFESKKALLTNCIYGVDKDFNAVEATKFGLLLKLLECEDCQTLGNSRHILPLLDNNIIYGNSLIDTVDVGLHSIPEINPHDFGSLKFDVIVGNPPYMKTEDMKNITPLELPIYSRKYTSAFQQFDKSYLFIERAMSLLKENGLLGYIVESKFLKVEAATKLREIITTNKWLSSLTYFGAIQVFPKVSTYTCLLTLSHSSIARFKYTEVKDLKGWVLHQAGASTTDERDASSIDAKPWIFCPAELEPAYLKIISNSCPLSNLIGSDHIYNGIQTSKNDVYIFVPTKEGRKYYSFYNKKLNREIKIEKSITKPYYITQRGNNALSPYRSFKPNARLIFPYEIDPSTGNYKLIAEQRFKATYPFAYSYLRKFQSELANRDISPTPKADEWFCFGRSQNLNAFGIAEKMIVGVLGATGKYAIDTNQTFITSGGTAGYCVISLPNTCQYSIYYIQAILCSKYLDWISTLSGEVFRGENYAKGTKVLMNLPIHVIDFNDPYQKGLHDRIAHHQKSLIAQGDVLAQNSSNPRRYKPLQIAFNIEKAALDADLVELYDLGNLDRIIPAIGY